MNGIPIILSTELRAQRRGEGIEGRGTKGTNLLNHKKGKCMRIQRFLLIILILITSRIDAMCPATSPWTAPVQLTTTGDVVSDVVSAATAAGFMATWADSSNNAHYSFSSDGVTWQSGLIPSVTANVGSGIDVFVAGNATGFLVAWADGLGNGWSSFTADNGNTWSAAQQINLNSLTLDTSSSVYVAGGASGFVATMMVPSSPTDDLYVSFSTGTSAWSAMPTRVTSDGTVFNINSPPKQYVPAVVSGNSCMVTWIDNIDGTDAAFIEPIDNLPATATRYPIINTGFFLSPPSAAYLNGYYVAVAEANIGPGVLISTATNATNWSTSIYYLNQQSVPPSPAANSFPWIAANQAGFISTWNVSGNPVWQVSIDNGFDWTPSCSILNTASSTITGPVALSANMRGFVSTWMDTNDSNAYVSFYFTPAGNVFSPTNLKGAQQVNRFFSQSDYMNVLTWNAPSLGDNPVSYSIYRNASLTDLAGVTQQLQFVDHDRKPGIQYSYYVVSVGAQGNMSAPAMIIV
jgi:hypothetical protein